MLKLPNVDHDDHHDPLCGEIAASERAEQERSRRWPRLDVWPRDYPSQVVAHVLAFTAAGAFRRYELVDAILELHDLTLEFVPIRWTALRMAKATIRRAKLERRIRWCSRSQQFVARPAWQHRPIHDRRGWAWPA